MSLTRMLMEQLGDERLDDLSRSIGADRRDTQKAIGMALPLLLGAMAKNASHREGAEALRGALERDHDGSLLQDLSGFLGRGGSSDGEGILGHVLGQRRDAVETAVSRSSGLDPKKAASLMAMLAPIVMAALGERRRSQGLDARGLGDLLAGERREVEKAAPGLGGLADLLDRDGDGSAMDDIADLARGALGSFLKRR